MLLIYFVLSSFCRVYFLRAGILAVALRHAKDRIGRSSNEAAEQSIGHMHPCLVVVENLSSNLSGRLQTRVGADGNN